MRSLVFVANLFILLSVEWFCYLLCLILFNRNHSIRQSIREKPAKRLTLSFFICFLLTVALQWTANL